MTAFYNENDPKAAAWLRELIKRDLIAPGVVDERSIVDVCPSELEGFTQCHFFAGVGVWSYALRAAGWPDDRPVWTGSCPCQPFSAAGKRAGTADERHLWPAFYHLIGLCRPDVVVGEQVESKGGRAWLDTVQADMEGLDYACGAVAAPAAGFGAPHARHRLYWVADAQHAVRWPVDGPREDERNGHDAGRQEAHRLAGACGAIRELAYNDGSRCGTWRSGEASDGRGPARVEPSGLCTTGVAQGDAHDTRPQGRRLLGATGGGNGVGECATGSPSATNGFWSGADWLPCTDGKARPVEPGTFPLAHGAPARVGRLRGYGNAIVAPVAEEFIRAYLGLVR